MIALSRPNLRATFILIIACLAAGLFYSMGWNKTGWELRLVLTLAGGMLLHLLATMLWQPDEWTKSLSPFFGKCVFVIAATVQTIGWLLLFDRIFPALSANGHTAMLAALLMAGQHALLYRHYHLPIVLQTLLAFAYMFVFSLLHAMAADYTLTLITLGLSMIFLSHDLHATRFATLSPLWSCMGCALFFIPCIMAAPGFIAQAGLAVVVLLGYTLALHSHMRALLWCFAASACSVWGYYMQVYVLHSSIWAITLPLWAVSCYGIYLITCKCQRRYLSPI